MSDVGAICYQWRGPQIVTGMRGEMTRPTLMRLGLLAGLMLLLTLQVLARPLLPIDETRYLSVAWEMHLSGDPFHLTRNFDSYSHKPPLLFWLINLVWLVTGVVEWAGRLIGPACTVALVWLSGRLARRLWPEDVGIDLRAMAVLAGFTVFLSYAGATMFDALLALPVVLGIGVIWRIGQGGAGWRLWALFGVVLAFGVYAKGPVILVHLAVPLLLIRLWADHPPNWGAMARGFGLALAVALGLVAVWLVPALLTGDGAFAHELLVSQTVDRVAGGMAHDRPVWFLTALLPVLLFPFGWALRLWPAVVRAGRGDSAGRLVAIWGVAALVLFSLISGKQAHYLIPEYPALALVIARATGSMRQRWGSVAPLGFAALGVGALAVAAGLVPVSGGFALADDPRWPLAVFGVVCLGLGAVAWRLPLVAGHTLAGAGLSLAIHGLIAATALYPAFDAHTLVPRLKAAEAGGLAVSGMPYNAEFNFVARLTQPVAVLEGPGIAAWAAAHPGGLLIGPVGRVDTTVPPAEVTDYGGRTIGLWPAGSLTFPG